MMADSERCYGVPTGWSKCQMCGTPRPVSITALSALEDERAAWGKQFGGGMIPFDDAYWEARDSGATIAEAQRVGVGAVLDEFVARVKEAFSHGR